MSTTGVNLTSMGLNSGTVSSGNGIDVTAVVNQILDSERGPEQLWQQQQTTLSSQTSALNSLNSSLNALKTAAQALTDITGIVTSNVATSSQTGILTASAQSSATAGSHLITVTSLATTASAYTDGVTDSNTTFQGGTITIQVGTTSNDITVDSSNNTLSQLADTINAQQIGVRASVINDATGAHLALVSQTTGKPGDLTIAGNTTGLVFHKASSGDNASLTIDGVPISSATNTVTGAIPGVTLNLVSSAPTTPVELTVGPDTSGISQAVSAFVSAYNSVISSINVQYLVGSDGSAGVLASNSSLRALQSSLLSDITYAMSDNNGYTSLRSLGITMANDGTLSVDSSKLNDVLSSHYADFQNFFQGVDTSFGANLANDLTSLTSPTEGILNTALNEISSEQKVLSDSINDFEARLAVRQQQLIKEYSQIDAMLREYPLQMQEINSQLNALSSMQSQK